MSENAFPEMPTPAFNPDNILLTGRTATVEEFNDYFTGKTLIGPDKIASNLFDPIGGRLFLVIKHPDFKNRTVR